MPESAVIPHEILAADGLDDAALTGAWLEVDLDAVAGNVATLRRLLPTSAAILAVVKGDGYGHGAVPVARVALANGATRLGVATVPEGLRLRRAGITAPILVMATVPEMAIDAGLMTGLHLIVSSEEEVRHIAARAEALDQVATVHLMLDSGLGREGCALREVGAIASAIRNENFLRLAGVGTQLASQSAALSEAISEQLACFELSLLGISALEGVPRHACSTAGALAGLGRWAYDMVRIGDGLYGVFDGPPEGVVGMREPLSIHARIVQIRTVAAGASAGYGGRWTAERDTRLALLPIGYGDGLPHALANGGVVLVAGQPCPVVAGGCMSVTTIDLGDTRASVGDPVVLIGRQGKQRVSLADWATMAATDPYDLTCRLGRALPRRYVGSGRVGTLHG